MFRWYGTALIIAVLSGAACAQSATIPSFETASVKVSQSQIGHEGTFTAGPDRVTARNTTLKRLCVLAENIEGTTRAEAGTGQGTS